MEYIGYIAAFCTTFAFFPQAYMAIKTKDVSGISLATYSIFCLGVALWFAYGLIKNDWPITIANLITLIPALTILFLKIKSNRKQES